MTQSRSLSSPFTFALLASLACLPLAGCGDTSSPGASATDSSNVGAGDAELAGISVTNRTVVFGDALGASWYLDGWSATETAQSAVVASGSSAVKGVISGAWGAAGFQHRTANWGALPVAVSGFNTLSFDINAGAVASSGVQTLQIALDGRAGQTIARYVSGGVLKANTWSHVKIPLSTLAGSAASLQWIQFFNASNQTGVTFYVDNLELTQEVTSVPSPTPSPTVTVTPTPSATPKPSVTPSPSVTVTPTPSATPAPSATPSPSVTVTPTPTPTPTPTVTPTPSPSVTPSPSGTPSACIGSDLLNSLGTSKLLVGYSGDDATATQAPFALRYQYITSPMADPTKACADYNWWGCWQDLSQAPGQYVTNFVAAAASHHEIPMLSYYMLLTSSGVTEGSPEVVKTNDAAFMTRYYADWRFLLQKIGNSTAFVQIEPDFWGYAEQYNSNPHLIASAVASANATDCAGYENSISGFGKCMVHMVRKYAPNAKVGLHASSWATKMDVLSNTNPAFDVVGEGQKLAAFLSASGGAESDYFSADMLDRDSGYYQSIGRATWWDATNATLPNFHQALSWSKAIAEAMGKPMMWWQVPVGNMNQTNTSTHWKDNRVQYFFDHPSEFAQAHTFGIAFGSGATGQTTPSTDGGYLVGRENSFATAGGLNVCQ